jgi:acetate kinase
MKPLLLRPNPRILTINGGSSSIKFAIFATDNPLRRIFAGEVARIGQPNSTLIVSGANAADDVSRTVDAANHHKAIDLVIAWIDRIGGRESLAAIGHRLVHGGPDFHEPELLTPLMLQTLHGLTSFDPEHMPEELLLAETFHQRFPDLPQVACFDTAFHHDLPRVAKLLPIPRRYEAIGLRRYGFHGLSYAFLMEELARIADPAATKGRVVLAHLGNGASVAAVLDGKSIDTSMGFTPTAGVPMSTRSGDLDPGVAWYLERREQMGAEQFNKMVNFESGLLGISETSSDLRELLAAESHDVRAAEALAIFCYAVKKQIGAYAAALGGIDTLVFAGGIGEKAATIRARICAGLEFLGIALDAPRNGQHASLISKETACVAVRVIQTDEELIIAKSVNRLLNLHDGKLVQ